jgi:large subunit ribosomal protein L22
MSQYNYSVQSIGANAAKAVGRTLPISPKKSIEICSLIRGMRVTKAKKILEDAISMKKPIPFTRFNKDVGHKRGIGAGRFPVSTCKEILSLLESAEANAQYKGLNTGTLIIKHISAQKAAGQWHYGRHFRRRMKRCNIEIVVEEGAVKKAEKKDGKPADKKVEVKKEEKVDKKPVEAKKEEKNEQKLEEKKEIKKEEVKKTEKVEKPVQKQKEEAKSEVKNQDQKEKQQEKKPEIGDKK